MASTHQKTSMSPLTPKKATQNPSLGKGKSTSPMLLSPLYQKPDSSLSVSVDTSNGSSPFDLAKVVNIIPVLPLSPHTAAYLNIKLPKDGQNISQFSTLKNKQGVTPLMKAAYKGNLGLIEECISPATPKSHIDMIDARGLTALCYACLSGHLATVEYLVEIGKAQVEGGDAPGIQPWVEVFTPTPLMLASFSGHSEVVRYLLKNGADVNARVGSPKGCTAIMIACWMRRMEVAKMLVHAGAVSNMETDDWVKQGLRRMKKLSVEYPIWEWELQGWLVKFKQPVVDPSKKLPAAKKDQLYLLSSDDMDDASKLIEILKSENPSAKLLDVPSRASVNNRKFAVPSQNDTLINSGGRLDLTEHLPIRGTDFDDAFLQVFKCITQLAVAANKHDKATYVVIAAKAIRFSTAILDMLETVRSSDRSPRDGFVPISPQYSPALSNKLFETSLFAKSDLVAVLNQQAKALRTEFQESLMFTTKIACGIWPPTTALSDMMQSAVALSRSCKSLVDLSNCLGFYSILDKQLLLQVFIFNKSSVIFNPSPTV
ncbi:hypothetical protein BDR26DRAFT_421340 [Obelidium mucronatum]|nr:hypothetical protein BDR26DRAFT_421340 [Obelidium mucronatum]